MDHPYSAQELLYDQAKAVNALKDHLAGELSCSQT